jgi:hypothetical protein
MVCRDVEDNGLAQKYLDSRLDRGLRDDFIRHLIDCRECRSALERLTPNPPKITPSPQESRSPVPVEAAGLRWAWIASIALGLAVVVAGVAWVVLNHVYRPNTAQPQSITKSVPSPR